MGEPAAPWALSLCPSAPLVCQAENGAVYRGGNSPPTRAKAGRWGGRSGRVCGLTVVQLHHKRVVYVSQDVSLHFGPNAVTHWSKEEGAYQRSGRPAQQRLQPWLRRTLFSTCSSDIFFMYSLLWILPQIAQRVPTSKLLANLALRPQQMHGI